MVVLAYLISAPLSGLEEVCDNNRPNRILFGINFTTSERDEGLLAQFSDILLGVVKGE